MEKNEAQKAWAFTIPYVLEGRRSSGSEAAKTYIVYGAGTGGNNARR